jgi:RHS repeat-associated protein
MQRTDYDAWGVITYDSSATFQSLGYAGGLMDRSTGLIRFGARDYDPGVGRWTCKDPIDFDGGQDNLYAYAGANPVEANDPAGLSVEFWAGEVGAAISSTAGNAAEAYAFAHDIRSTFQQRLPGTENSSARHQAASEMIAGEYGSGITRAMGVGNELQGFLFHDLPDLRNRLNGGRPWAFEFRDLVDNEVGIWKATHGKKHKANRPTAGRCDARTGARR